MPSINITADARNAITAMNQLTAELQAVDDRIRKVTASQAIFNQQGVQTGAVIRGLTHDGKEFTAVMGLMGRNAQQLASMGIATNLSLKRLDFKSKAKDLDELSNKTADWAHVLGRVQRALQYFLAYRAFNFISNQLQQGVQSAKDFQIELSLIRTLSQEAQQSFVKFGEDVRGVSDRTGLDILKVGKAFYDTISNQIAKGSNIAPFVETAGNLARVTGSEIPDSVNLLSSAINAYGFSVTDAERLSAIFFKTIDEGRVVASELANTFGRVAVIASNLGISIEEVNATIGITTQKGFKTADALTLLTNLMIKLEKPTEGTKAFFQSLGVSSGEAAIKLYGFNGVLRRMVDAVKSGQADVSAFFDEIRGRKQFGVFEQSIDQIEDFAERLKDTTEVMQNYSRALEIRDESPAEKLVKEFNKLSNVFTVDFGQGVLKVTADLLQLVGGIDGVSKASDLAAAVIRSFGIVLVAYGVTAVGTSVANVGLARSFAGVTASAALLTRVLLPLGAAFVAFEGGKMALRAGVKDVFGSIDPSQLNATADSIEKIKQKYDLLKESVQKSNPFAGLEKQTQDMNKAFQEALGLVAGANKANNKFLDDTKRKSQETAEGVKIAFAGYVDTIKANIGEIKKGITESNREIERSTKSLLGFRDNLEKLIYETKMKYANEEFGGDFGQLGGQKAKLMEQQIGKLRDRAYQLFAIGSPEAIDEGRRIFDEIGRMEKERFEFLTDIEKKQAELAGTTGIFYVDTLPLQEKLNQLLAERNALEEKYVNDQKQSVIINTQKAAKDTESLRVAEAAMKKFMEFNAFDDKGKIDKRFKDGSGKFDKFKLINEVKGLERDILNAFSGSGEEKVKLYADISERRKAIMAEAEAQDRTEYFKTLEARLLGEQEIYQKRINDLKKIRQEELDRQNSLMTAIGQKPAELALFGNKLVEAGGISNEDKKAIAQRIEAYSNAVKRLFSDKMDKDGIKLFKPENLDEARAEYDAAVREIERLRVAAGKDANLTIQDANGRDINTINARAAFDLQVKELMQSWLKVQAGMTEEMLGGKAFNELVNQPILQLKAQFPELAEAAKDSTLKMGQHFKNLADGGVEALRKKLQEVNDLMKMGAGGGAGKADGVHMASGGLVGLFPGQPRGTDRYPIWAAKGEYIINARSAAMFKPMLDAINNARTPRYMNSGGSIGDTSIGDITVNVSGASTNSETGYAVASKLERLFRRNLIRR